jgi:hypothetical protein
LTSECVCATQRLHDTTGVFLDIIDKPSISDPKEIDIAEPLASDSTLVVMAMKSIDWTTPYIIYLDHQVLPQDEMEARKI